MPTRITPRTNRARRYSCLATAAVKGIVVASPANPTGTMMEAQALARLIAVAEAEGFIRDPMNICDTAEMMGRPAALGAMEELGGWHEHTQARTAFTQGSVAFGVAIHANRGNLADAERIVTVFRDLADSPDSQERAEYAAARAFAGRFRDRSASSCQMASTR